MKRLINDRWKFIKTLPGSTPEDLPEPGKWTEVDLPHDWLIWQENNLYESADAWYMRELEKTEEQASVSMIRFDGVYMDCDVLLNGEIICSHPYGYTAFTADLTGKLHSGKNQLMVHIRHQSPNSRWYSGSGIFRDVTWINLPEDHVVPWSFYITEKEETDGFRVRISAETSGKDRVLFSFNVLDQENKAVAASETQSRDHHVTADILIRNPVCWSLSEPYLYTLRYQYGEEQGSLRFGIRTLCFDPDQGFFLNGVKTKLKGVCLHHDLGALGAAFHEKAARRQLKLMKEMGANAIRTSHNPPAEKLLDLCDEMGILVIDEAFDMWERPKTEYDYARFFPDWEAKDVASWIRRDRCHPSVIMWSVGNEIYDMHADMRGTEVTGMLKEQVEQHDPEHHGVVTFGCNYMPWEGGQRCADVVKVAGYNYGEKYYEEHHRKHPDWVIYGSETASVLSSRNIYHFPIENSIMSESDLQCSALGNSNTSWGAENLGRIIVEDLKCPFSMGQFIWSGIDYIGEPTPYHTRSCYFGQADTACFPKDSFYLFRSFWNPELTLHIGVYWDWNPGQLIDVPVMTNCASVELFLNGRSLGKKTPDYGAPEKCLPVWKVPYEPGELRAAGYDQEGRKMLEDVRFTPGDTHHLNLTAEDDVLFADGYDITFVTVSAEDQSGHPVENARDRVRISVRGGGCLMGTDNGDSTDRDGYKSSERRLFGGKLLLIIGSTGDPENVQITVEGTMGKYDLEIPTGKAEIREGTSRRMRIPETGIPQKDPIRKIEIRAEGNTHLDPVYNECVFSRKILPENAARQDIQWQITNGAGIRTPYASLQENGDRVRVHVTGDGYFYLRAMTGETKDHPDIISQIEITADGIGNPALNPYEFVSAGLYDIHSGEIGTGNEKGIAFSREGESMIGFSSVDFGRDGSDCLILPIFALNGDMYEIELFDGIPGQGGKLIETLRYQKPSIWNTYQEEIYRLSERLTGIRTVCFRMKDKVHMKGFRFEKQIRAFSRLAAADADAIYGDSFRKDGKTIREIGNNVSLSFEEMEFGETRETVLEIQGKTPLPFNTVTIRISGENGESITEIAEFSGNGGNVQRFQVKIPGGKCTVTFVFLPGSRFDFEGFRFFPAK